MSEKESAAYRIDSHQLSKMVDECDVGRSALGTPTRSSYCEARRRIRPPGGKQPLTRRPENVAWTATACFHSKGRAEPGQHRAPADVQSIEPPFPPHPDLAPGVRSSALTLPDTSALSSSSSADEWPATKTTHLSSCTHTRVEEEKDKDKGWERCTGERLVGRGVAVGQCCRRAVSLSSDADLGLGLIQVRNEIGGVHRNVSQLVESFLFINTLFISIWYF